MNKIIYKKIDQAETLKRPMKPLSTKHKTQARATVQKFVDLLKSTN